MATSGQQPRGSGVTRMVAKLDTALENQDYYQAHQLYRTIYFRYCAAGRYPELVELLFDGGCRLLDSGQAGSGSDLANLLLDTLIKSNAAVNSPDNLEKVRQLFSRMHCQQKLASARPPAAGNSSSSSSSYSPTTAPAATSQPLLKAQAKPTPAPPTEAQQESAAVDRNAFIQLAVKWSKQVTPQYGYGHPNLHQQFAQVFWAEKNYTDARYHFMLSHDSEGCASFLIEYHLSCGFPTEIDLFIAQAVLQFLCHRNRHVASSTFDHYTHKHPEISGKGGPPYTLPLLNFLWMLLCVVNEEPPNVGRFSTLCVKYHPSIRRDPCYPGYVDLIGQIWFGFPPPRPAGGAMGGGGFLANMIQNLMGGEVDSNACGGGPASAGGGGMADNFNSLLSSCNGDEVSEDEFEIGQMAGGTARNSSADGGNRQSSQQRNVGNGTVMVGGQKPPLPKVVKMQEDDLD